MTMTMTIDEEGWETVDAQSYFVEKFLKKISTSNFLPNVKNKFLMKVIKNVIKKEFS